LGAYRTLCLARARELSTSGGHGNGRSPVPPSGGVCDQVKAKNHVVKDIQKGNRELLQKNARLEMRIIELNDELMRTYRSRDFKTDDLDDTRT
jgi:hypothetical protein